MNDDGRVQSEHKIIERAASTESEIVHTQQNFFVEKLVKNSFKEDDEDEDKIDQDEDEEFEAIGNLLVIRNFLKILIFII